MHDIIKMMLKEKFLNTFGFEVSEDTLELILKDMIWNGCTTIKV